MDIGTKFHTIFIIITVVVVLVGMLVFGPLLLGIFQQALPAITQGIGLTTSAASMILEQASEAYKNVLGGVGCVISNTVAVSGGIMSSGIGTCGSMMTTGMNAAGSVATAGIGEMTSLGSSSLKSIIGMSGNVGSMLSAGSSMTSSLLQSGMGVMRNGMSSFDTISRGANDATKSLGSVTSTTLESASRFSGAAAIVSQGVSQVTSAAASGASLMLTMGIAMPGFALISGGTQVIRFLATPLHTAASAISTISSTLSTLSSTVSSVYTAINSIASAFGAGRIANFIMDTVVNNFSRLTSSLTTFIRNLISSEGCSLLGSILGYNLCHIGDSEIYTENGWIPINSVSVGQKIYTKSGKLEIVRSVIKSTVDEVALYDFTTGSHPIPMDDGIVCYIIPESFGYLEMTTIPVPADVKISMAKNAVMVNLETEGPEHTYQCRKDGKNGIFRDISLIDGKCIITSLLMYKFLSKYFDKIVNNIEKIPSIFENVMNELKDSLLPSVDSAEISLQDSVNFMAEYNANKSNMNSLFIMRFSGEKSYMFFYHIFSMLYYFESYISFPSYSSCAFNVPSLDNLS